MGALDDILLTLLLTWRYSHEYQLNGETRWIIL